MRFSLAAIFFLFTNSLFAQQPSVPEIRYRSVPDFLTLPPTSTSAKPSASRSTPKPTSSSSLAATYRPSLRRRRCAATRIRPRRKISPRNRPQSLRLVLRTFIRIDREDNIWVADKGSDMVIKFNPQGRVVMVFGRKQEASDEGTEPLKHPKPPLPAVDGMFRQVTDMAWDSAGNTYISDGYVNSRVAKADKMASG